MRNDHSPRPQTAHPLDPADVQAISDWLVKQGLYTAGFETLFAGFCERLAAAGVPLWRGQVAMRTLHPSVDAIAYRWRPASGVESASLLYSDSESEAWLRSPFHHMLASGARTLRHRLDGERTTLPFPILDEFRAAGATDYYARFIGFRFEARKDARSGVISSWTTDQAGGFSEQDISTLDRLLPRLALSLKSTLTYQFSINLLDTYVGPDAGRRILGGEIRRGAAEVIRAVLWLADLRGFTAFSDTTPKEEVFGTLDEYFDCMVRPLVGHGGQVLKFLGDGLLGTFDLQHMEKDAVCRESLDSAVEALKLVHELNAERRAAGKPVLELDLALHLGDVLYGNVGALDRQDFTLIGAAVNEASRIETLCAPLDRNLLISETFAKAASQCTGRLVSLGRHHLRGVREAQELFTVDLPGTAG